MERHTDLRYCWKCGGWFPLTSFSRRGGVLSDTCDSCYMKLRSEGFVVGVSSGEDIIGMTKFEDYVLVATTGGLYRVEGDKAVKIQLDNTSKYWV